MLECLPGRFQELKSWLDAGLSFLYPEVCQYCAKARASVADGYICEDCRRQAKIILPPFCRRCGLPFPADIDTDFECANCREMPLHFSWARSAVTAEGMVLDLIHRYKYRGALWVEPFLARLLVDQAAPQLRKGRWNMIVPIPLHPLKQREREFNQAERLARHLGRAAELPLHHQLLQRIRSTETQTRLSRSQRTANVKHAFRLRHGASPKGKRIVLVDDVFTTGATSSACARVLRKAGARDVCVWTLARGIFN